MSTRSSLTPRGVVPLSPMADLGRGTECEVGTRSLESGCGDEGASGREPKDPEEVPRESF